MLEIFLQNADAGINHPYARIVDRRDGLAAEPLTGQEGLVPRLDGELPALSHRVAGIDREIDDHLLDLALIGAEPPLTQIENPVARPDYQLVSMPMPAPRPVERNANSLWRTGARAFFKDQRAGEIGDILTVVVDLDDQAQINNATTRTRTATQDASLNALLGYETSLNRVLPEAISPGNLLDANSTTNSSGTGMIARDKDIELRIAVVITQILPNGNMAIYRRQEIRVNFEARQL